MREKAAVCLYSGGLDSILAIKLMLDQGFTITALKLVTPFFYERSDPVWVLEQEGVTIHHLDITNEFLDMLGSPQYGYGKNLNPCLDCKILMLKRAKNVMHKIGARFVFTGEVVGQRPMSQMKNNLRMLEKKSGLDGFLLRPLSAQLLPLTIMEQEGLIDRAKLLGINGRSRKMQIVMAMELGLVDYPTPAGGCRLTDPQFCRRLRLLLDGRKRLDRFDIELLTIGRHFLLPRGEKESLKRVVVGRNKEENAKLLSIASSMHIIMKSTDFPGPTGILVGTFSNDDLKAAASIIARYTDKGGRDIITIQIHPSGGAPSVGQCIESIQVPALSEDRLVSMRI
ncbi:MAG: tRNA 4-thiouridine(8) synthase ThiI [bacterium]